MSQWIEVRHEMEGTWNGRHGVVNRRIVTRFESDGRRTAAHPGERLALLATRPELQFAPYSRFRERARGSNIGAPPTLTGIYERENHTAETHDGSDRVDRSRRISKPLKPRSLVYERLFSAPGCYVRIPFGPMRKLIGPTLRNPDAVTDVGPIEGLLQVYRILRPVSLNALVAAESGGPFFLLTEALTGSLGLPPHWAVSSEIAEAEGIGRTVRPGQILWRFIPTFDPSTNAASRPSRAESTSPPPAAEASSPDPQDGRTQDPPV